MMDLRTVAQVAVLLTLISYAGDGYSQTAAGESAGGTVDRIDLFRPVFEIMTVRAADDSPGCRGCHIGSDAFAPWGQSTVDTAEETLNQLEQERPGLLEGGRFGTLGDLLHSGQMPRLGMRWNQDQLDLLDAWLVSYE